MTNKTLEKLFDAQTTNHQNVADEVKSSLSQITPLLISSKIEQQAVFAQSAMDGGPTSSNGAIINLMDYCSIGYRSLALETGRKRKVLQEMIQGIRPMPPEVVTELYEIFKKRKPALFEDS